MLRALGTVLLQVGGRRLHFVAGETIVSEGDHGDDLLWLEKGAVRCTPGPERLEVAVLEEGDTLGGLAFLDGLPRSATAVAATETSVLSFSREALERVGAVDIVLAHRVKDSLLHVLSSRVRETTRMGIVIEEQRHELDQAHEETKAAQTELVHAARMASLGQLTAGIAHELNNPVAATERTAEHVVENVRDLFEWFGSTSWQSLSSEDRALLLSLITAALDCGLRADRHSSTEARRARRVMEERLRSEGVERASAYADALARLAEKRDVTALLQLAGRHGAARSLEPVARGVSLGGALRTIQLGASRVSQVVCSLRLYSRLGEDTVGESDVRSGLEDALVLHQHEMRSGIEVVRDFQDVPLIRARPAELNQVWSNLVRNAIQAMEGKGLLRIAVQEVEDGVLVTIADTGCGIPQETIAKIFEPHFTTKRGTTEFGLGLGLAIVRSIVERHHGNVRVESRPGATTFTVRLPRKATL